MLKTAPAAYHTLQVIASEDGFGAEIIGVDLSRPLLPETLAELKDAWARHAVVSFPDQPLMEDVELAHRLWRVGRMVTVPAEVRASGRRFLRQPVRAVLALRLFPVLYRLGPPRQSRAPSPGSIPCGPPGAATGTRPTRAWPRPR